MNRLAMYLRVALVTSLVACASAESSSEQTVDAAAQTSVPRTAAATRAAIAAPTLPGTWNFSTFVGMNPITGTITFAQDASTGAYSAKMAVQDDTPLVVGDIVVNGSAVTFTVSAPDGLYSVKGSLAEDNRFAGTLTGPRANGSFTAVRE